MMHLVEAVAYCVQNGASKFLGTIFYSSGMKAVDSRSYVFGDTVFKNRSPRVSQKLKCHSNMNIFLLYLVNSIIIQLRITCNFHTSSVSSSLFL